MLHQQLQHQPPGDALWWLQDVRYTSYQVDAVLRTVISSSSSLLSYVQYEIVFPCAINITRYSV